MDNNTPTNGRLQALLKTVHAFALKRRSPGRDGAGVVCLDPTLHCPHMLSIDGASYLDVDDDPLRVPWEERFIWAPLPLGSRGGYGPVGKTLRKARREHRALHFAEGLFLVPVQPEAEWYAPLHGRPRVELPGPIPLRLGRGGYSEQLACIVYVGRCVKSFRNHFSALGRYVPPSEEDAIDELFGPE